MTRRLSRQASLLLLTLAASAGLAHAESPAPQVNAGAPANASPANASPASADLTRIEGEIGSSQARQAELSSAIAAALAEQEALSKRLVEVAETTTSQEQALARTEKRSAKLQQQVAILSLDLAQQQDVLSDVLAGLQQMEQNPPPALVVQPHDVLQALRSAMLFGAIVPELKGKAEALQTQLQDLATLKDKLAAEAKERESALAALQASRGEMQSLMAQKEALAKATRQDLEAERQHGAQLAEQAKTLKQLLARLEEDRLRQEAELKARQEAEAKAGAAAAEAERQRQQALAAPVPAMAFGLAKGRLPYPAQGTLVKAYGDDTGLGTRFDGIVISTAAEAQVIAPVSGKIEFAGPFRSYGQLVILNAGDGYLVLMAGLGRILASPGQSVRAGEPLGLMGQSFGGMAALNGLTQQKTPVLYVEFRKNGDPVDPAPWWAGNRQEAMR